MEGGISVALGHRGGNWWNVIKRSEKDGWVDRCVLRIAS